MKANLGTLELTLPAGENQSPQVCGYLNLSLGLSYLVFHNANIVVPFLPPTKVPKWEFSPLKINSESNTPNCTSPSWGPSMFKRYRVFLTLCWIN